MELKTFFYDWNGYNRIIFFTINHSFAHANIQYFFKYLSYFFNISNFAIYYITLVIFKIISFRKNKISEEEFLNSYNYFVRIGICYAFIGLFYALMKFTINMPRPFCAAEIGSFFTVLDTASERCLSGFPSAHTAVAILCVFALWSSLVFYQKLIAAFIVVLVMLSRIALAMHFPADIIYSIAIAYSIIKLACYFYNLLKNNLIAYIGRFIYLRFIS